MIHTDDGRFAQRGVLAAARTIVIGGFDIAHKVIDVDIPEGDVFDLGDINVDRGQIVRGRVTDASGAPVAGSTVVARQQPGVVRGGPDPLQRRMLGGATATTDEHGDYELVVSARRRFGPRLWRDARVLCEAHAYRSRRGERRS